MLMLRCDEYSHNSSLDAPDPPPTTNSTHLLQRPSHHPRRRVQTLVARAGREAFVFCAMGGGEGEGVESEEGRDEASGRDADAETGSDTEDDGACFASFRCAQSVLNRSTAAKLSLNL